MEKRGEVVGNLNTILSESELFALEINQVHVDAEKLFRCAVFGTLHYGEEGRLAAQGEYQ